MALGTFIAGRYSSTWNSVAMGIMENGYDVSYDPKQELINRSDQYGDTLLDMVYRGGDWSMQCDTLEWMAGVTGPAFPFGTALGVLGTIGRLCSDIAAALVLTATAGTPAAAAPATLTASKAILAANANPRIILNSVLRKVPIRFTFLPYDAAGTIKHIVLT